MEERHGPTLWKSGALAPRSATIIIGALASEGLYVGYSAGIGTGTRLSMGTNSRSACPV